MTLNNPNNYPGMTVAPLVGRVAGSPEFPRYDPEGKRGYKDVRVAYDDGYKSKETGEWVKTGTTWVTVHRNDWDELPTPVGKGDLIRIDGGRLTCREYTAKDGTERIGLQVDYGTLTVVNSKSNAAPESGTPF